MFCKSTRTTPVSCPSGLVLQSTIALVARAVPLRSQYASRRLLSVALHREAGNLLVLCARGPADRTAARGPRRLRSNLECQRSSLFTALVRRRLPRPILPARSFRRQLFSAAGSVV